MADIRTYLQGKGYAVLPVSWYQHIGTWQEWYKGKVDSFHKYSQYNGEKMVGRTRQSLGMAKQVSEDKADLLLNEKVEINIGDESTQNEIDDILEKNNFWVRGNNLVELACAMGTGAFVEYLDDQEIRIDYIDALAVFPLSWRNGRVIECAFGSQYVDETGEYTYISIHQLNDTDQYVVKNILLDDEGKEVMLPGGVIELFETGSSIPLFQLIQPNIVNNIDPHIPMGISVFANAIDVLKGIDLVYDSYDNEFRLGKKRIFVDASATRVDTNSGSFQPIFDTNDTEFYALDMEKTKESIKEINMELRSEEHETALQSRLNLLSAKCGFGQNYYQWDGQSVKTATEVISENSQLYRKIKKDEIILEKALVDLVAAIAHLKNTFLGGSMKVDDISISFDDSIIEDTEAIAKRAMLEKNSGIIDTVAYLERVYGYTEEQAIKYVAGMKKRSPAPKEGDFFSGSDGE